MNCFQISNFVLWQTAKSYLCSWRHWLWIAFKLVTLSYDKQHNGYFRICSLVVNCFQISNFVLWQTAKYISFRTLNRLWIAFKLVTLSYDKQPFLWRRICQRRSPAELMKHLLWIAFKLVTLSYDKQQYFAHHRRGIVVNCFQISNFVLWQTARRPSASTRRSCELLSN